MTQTLCKLCVKITQTLHNVFYFIGKMFDYMKTVLVCNQKGGVGKTLISDELVYAFERDEIPHNYFDLDTQGGSLHKQITNDDAIVQVIDTPGAIQEDLINWIEQADMIIVPTKLTLRDVPPLQTMIEILEPYKDKKPILYVLNGWNRYTSSKQFTDWFAQTYPDLKSTILCQSEHFNYAAALGESVYDYKTDSTPAQQIYYIYSAIKFELGIKEGWR